MASFRQLHDWNLSPQQAVQLQNELRNRVLTSPLNREIELVAGADISFNKYSETVYAGIVVLNLTTMQTVETASVVTQAKFPYIPGLLSFRETPAILEAWQKLQYEPDVLILDGQGTAHPRRFGIACHVGLLLERPTVGCAKSVLVGQFDEPNSVRGAWSPMVHRGETVGAALCTKNNVSPVYVSPGHEIDLESSIALALRCDGGYRVPEPTRRAHLLVNEVRRAHGEQLPA
jgi:deoxyribonuclease V